MKVRLTETRVDGFDVQRPGDIVDVSKKEAQAMMENGQAVPANDTQERETATEEGAETRQATPASASNTQKKKSSKNRRTKQ